MNKVFVQPAESPLGPMVSGATDNGLCFLEWEDRGGVERIRQRVIKRYKCDLVELDTPILQQLREELALYFDGTLRDFKTPIDVAGTAFEKTVWDELLRIPYGVTRSYGEMAVRLNKPGAQRAVGRANGANYLGIVIPCHRVIEATGKLRGYGGKLWRKKALLELESGQRVLNVAS